MTENDRQKLINTLRELGKADKYHLFIGKVDEVNETSLKMKVDLDDGVIVSNVRLRSLITDNSKGWWVIPKVGTKVTIGLLEGGTDFLLINASEIDKFFIKIASKVFEMDTNGIKFNGGSNDGIPKVTPLVSKINGVENKVNGILNLLNGWTPVANDGGAALKTAFSALFSTTLAPITPITNANDLKNPDVKH